VWLGKAQNGEGNNLLDNIAFSSMQKTAVFGIREMLLHKLLFPQSDLLPLI